MKIDKDVQRLVDGYGNWVKKDSVNEPLGVSRMTSDLYPYTSIFSPIRVNKIEIKNRLVMAPMGNIDMCEESGRPNQKMLNYFFERAKGGTGLLTTGLVPISHGIDPTVTEKKNLTYFPRIDSSRTNLMGWRDLAQGVHAYDSKIFIQLSAGLGRVGNPQCLLEKYQLPVSSSFNPNFYISEIPCRRISDRKLTKIIKNFGQASSDAKHCGLDGVYLHAHEGYLIEQMTNPAFNRRKLGKYRDYKKFGVDIIKEIRRRVGPHYPIMYRIDLSLALNETYGKDGMNVKQLRKFKNGRDIADSLDFMKDLVAAGVDMFDVDLGCYDNWWLPHPPSSMPSGCYVDIAAITKKYFKDNNIKSNLGLEVPVVAVGKLGYPDLAEKVLREEKCDMVMLGRPLLSDPDWPNKAFSNRVDEIKPCIGCQEGCINEFVEAGHPQCAINARTGFEDVFPSKLIKTNKPKKVCIVGGGPGGMEMAYILAKRGHTVELFEKSNKLGGRVVPGSVPKIKFDVENYLKFLEDRTKKTEEKYNLKVHMNTTVTTDMIKKGKYDEVVLAYGTRDINIPFKGIEKVKTVQGVDVLVDPNLTKGVSKAVIIGGGVVGCETAYYLKYEKGIDVDVVEMMPHFMKGVCTANRAHLIHYLKKENVNLYNCAKVVSFGDGLVNIERNVSKTVPNPYNTWQPILPDNVENPLAKKIKTDIEEMSIKADLFILAMGGVADRTFFKKAQQEQVAPLIHTIGDSARPGKILEAVRNAYRLGIEI